MNLLGAPIEFPNVPFATEIPGGVRVGLLVRIQGKAFKHASRFHVDFTSGNRILSPTLDIGFHFNPRFDEKYVARNSLMSEHWGAEEYGSPSHFPFVKDRAFEIMIIVEAIHYKVAVDGVHFLEFVHRMPIERLTTLQISGDVTIHKLEFLDSRPPQPTYGFQPSAPGMGYAPPAQGTGYAPPAQGTGYVPPAQGMGYVPPAQGMGYAPPGQGMGFVPPPPMGVALFQPVEIFNPDIPLVNEIPGGNRVGLLIKINGKIPKRSDEFIVNLATGPEIYEPRSDIGFHFNPRFDCGYVARNSLIDESWGDEENDNPDTLPFSHGEKFELAIIVESHQYKVSVNGIHFLHYTHRIPINRLNTLQILGEVKIHKLEFLNHKPDSGYQQSPIGIAQPREILNPAVPFRQVLHGGMFVGKSIFMTGRPKPYATRFSINFERTRDGEPDIVFHLNPRFGGMGDEEGSVVVRNHFHDGDWGFEERDMTAFPFVQGFNFDMTILCEQEFYLVAVNGQHLLSFRHRVPFQNVDTLYIAGDVDIMLVRF